MEGFQKPFRPTARREVRLAVISEKRDGVTCNCGWVFAHPRAKVFRDRAQKHVDKRHSGRGIWV